MFGLLLLCLSVTFIRGKHGVVISSRKCAGYVFICHFPPMPDKLQIRRIDSVKNTHQEHMFAYAINPEYDQYSLKII